MEAKSWWWVKVHAIPVARYLDRGTNGTETLREEIEAEIVGDPGPLYGQMAERGAKRQGPLLRGNHQGIVDGSGSA